MKKIYVLISVFVIIIVSVSVSAMKVDLPTSLDKLYPPYSNTSQLYDLMKTIMLSYAALNKYVESMDYDKAENYALKLLFSYRSLERMVPEWKNSEYRKAFTSIVDDVKARNIESLKARMITIGYTCENCHSVYQAKVKAKYHARYTNTSVHLYNPIKNGPSDYKEYMDSMEKSLYEIKIHIENNEWSDTDIKAQKLFMAYEGLKGTCANCHSNDASIGRLFGDNYQRLKVHTMFNIQTYDKKSTPVNFDTLYEGYCQSCHYIHRWPSKYSKSYSTGED